MKPDFHRLWVNTPFGQYKNVRMWGRTGSSYICNPPVTDTDEDFFVQALLGQMDALGKELEDDGWSVTYDDPEYTIEKNREIPFITARKGKQNLIIFQDDEAFIAFDKATEVAKRLNLLKKEDRVMLFQAVCWGRGDRF